MVRFDVYLGSSGNRRWNVTWCFVKSEFFLRICKMLAPCPDRLFYFLALTVVFVVCSQAARGRSSDHNSQESYNLKSVLVCLRREYTLKATRSDNLGRRCWDFIRATSCWGRCDSFEIPDWRFPYKISIHPVCMHDQKRLRRVRLRHCDPPDADDRLRNYEYYDAETCSCGVCNSSDTFCDWKGHMHHHQRVVVPVQLPKKTPEEEEDIDA
ncbi:hypothetical protein JTE90_010561 [Oedothorax gibbosus]|uniref:Glycoprotein hormone subunit beta domain-containing protein n=1 Tax=Oedothorax gibbosus TaxID=931172 RepID=A0AAV6UHA0_9ARAC|nr:hypothetical protein JTE90_010561 [Oedothorax gibbosus]